MNEFFRFDNKEFKTLQEASKYAIEKFESDCEVEFVIERVFVTNKDQWGGYSETVQEVVLKQREKIQ